VSTTLPSPYEAPELYDLALEAFQDDLGFWLDEARRAAAAPGRPARVLEVSCGTGRVLLHLRAHGIAPRKEVLRNGCAEDGHLPPQGEEATLAGAR